MNYSRPWMYGGLAAMAAGAALLWLQGPEPRALAEPPKAATPSTKGQTKTVAADPYQWKSLFDGKLLTGWKAPQFGGEGKVYVKDGAIVMDTGAMMTGITWTGAVIRNNYELTLEGMRLDGVDFFCTTTFPVGKDYCSFVVGGWGGIVVGLSSVDYNDASENATTRTMEFKDKRWYKIRIRVSDAAIEAWIDNEKMVEQPREGHKFTIRLEVDECRPLGVCTWCTKGAVRNLRVRALRPDEVKTIAVQIKAAEKNE